MEGWLKPGWLPRVEGSCNQISILMVHETRSYLGTLGVILSEQLRAEIRHVGDCQEASCALHERRVPHLVLTDSKLPDGSWEDILEMAATASQPVNVLVVSRIGNIGLYTDAMMRGAFDVITPNIPPTVFIRVLSNAAEDVYRRRESQAGT